MFARPHLRRKRLPAGRASDRAFTLIELMVVVLIITVFAGLAIPTIVAQMRDRRVQESARKIAALYRQARLRAVGRGAAVLVRFDNGAFTVLEARLGGAAAAGECSELPMSSCLNTSWVDDPTTQEIVDGHAESTEGEMNNVTLGMTDAANNILAQVEICFTPFGRAFSRNAVNDAVAFTPLTATYLASVNRPGMGRSRQVVLMPNGTARMTE